MGWLGVSVAEWGGRGSLLQSGVGGGLFYAEWGGSSVVLSGLGGGLCCAEWRASVALSM